MADSYHPNLESLLTSDYYLWHNRFVQLFIERFLLTVFAAAFIAVVFGNPMKFDWTQRITLSLALVFSAYFVAHTAHKSNKEQVDDSASVNLLEEKSSQSASPVAASQSTSEDNQKASQPAVSNTNIPASSPAQSIPTVKASSTPPTASAIEPKQSRNLQKKESASIYVKQARALFEKEQFLAALAKCNKALRLEPGNREALDLRALINRFSDPPK